MSAFERPVSASEQLYLAGLRVVPPATIQIAVVGEGMQLPDLRAAVMAAAHADPGCRLVLARGATRWVAAQQPPQVHAEGGAVDLDAACLREPLDPFVGPTCSVLLFEDCVLFRAFHGVMDAGGVLDWIRNVFRALRGEPLLPHDDPITEEALAAAHGPRPKRPAARLDAPCALVPPGADPLVSRWTRRSIEGLARLPIPVVAAALAELHRSLGETRPLRALVPADLRRRDPVASTGNLSLPLFLDLAPEADLPSITAQLLRRLERREECQLDPSEAWLNRLPHALVASGIGWVCRWGAARGRFAATAILSHLGRISLDDFSAPGFRARTLWSLPVSAGLVPTVMSIVELDDHVQVAVTAPAHTEAQARTTAWLDGIELLARATLPSRPAGVNDTVRPLAPEGLYSAFLAALHPGVAQRCEGETLDYPSLDRWARRIGGALQEAGLAAGDRVLVPVERGPALLAAWLGVWAAGGVVVPVDPHYPASRVEWIRRDSGVTLDVSDFLEGSAPISPHLSAPDAIAYLMYTSGSTGRPKGVAISHGAALNYARCAAEAYGIGRDTRFACFTSPAFDLTLTSTLAPLLAGATVEMLPGPFGPLTPERLVASGATAVKLTPAHLMLLADVPSLSSSGLGLLVVGGAQLGTALAARIQRALPAARIINEYGPTECTVGCTWHRFAGEEGPVVPIGRPGFNQRVYVLDDLDRPVGPSLPGELWIAGSGLAAGYHGDPVLTDARFRALPSVGEGRAYRTGDRVRWGPGGVLVFEGRVDRQLEIRGHRVEPAEIEQAIEGVPGVVGAAVAQVDGVLGAWFVGDVGSKEVQAHLRQVLPGAWCPAFALPVPELPLTVHGKLDVGALPRPDRPPVSPPGDPIEEAVRRIWATALGSEPETLGAQTTLHELGGDSVVLVDIFRRLQSSLPPQTDPAQLLARLTPSLGAPTIMNMAAAVRELSR